MKKYIIFTLVLIGIIISNFALSQDSAINRSNHNVYIEIGGAYFIGASINYEYSFYISKILRVNPGLGFGFVYAGIDASQEYYLLAIPNVKVLLGKTKHFFELGMNYYYGYNFGGVAGYRKNSAKNPLFFRATLNISQFSGTPWFGLSIGYRFLKKNRN